jgi:light-regulated signal transduction histidine kinase (bacteriophytochrome)
LPTFNPACVEVTRVVLSTLVSLLVSRVATTRRNAETLLRTAKEELEWRVRERTMELEQANAALAQKAAEFERANAELEQYTHAASHDLQEPARMMALYSQLLTRRYGPELDSRAWELVEVIENNARRMLALIDSLLSYSRLIAETEKSLRPVPLSDVVAEAMANCHASMSENAAEVTCGELPTVHGDRGELVRVFQNLLSNAIKYRSDVPPRVAINAFADGDMWTVVIRDNGIGIDMQYADRIFQAFKRLHGHDVPGIGMGLAICKKIIEDHGGRIWVDSAPGQGATFQFTLPLIGSRDEGTHDTMPHHDSGRSILNSEGRGKDA